MAKIFCEKPVCSSRLKRNNSFPPIKSTATGFSAIRKPLPIFFGKMFYKVIILKSNVPKTIIIKKYEASLRQKKKSSCTKQVFINLLFQRIL